MKTFIIILVTLGLIGCNNASKTDKVMPPNLIGISLKYSYSEGNRYHLKFEEGGISYQYSSGSRPEKWWGKFSYNHLLTDKGEHFVSWHEPEYGDYVTLLINFENNILYGSAILKGKTVHFQEASISEITLLKK